jgi:hypothetical protein
MTSRSTALRTRSTAAQSLHLPRPRHARLQNPETIRQRANAAAR